MLYIDSHIHIGDYEKVKFALEHSIFKEKYRLYSSLSAEAVRLQDNYIHQCDFIFGIPIVLKEISVEEANQFLLSYCLNRKNILPVYLVSNNITFYEKEDVYILKEHFIHHESKHWKERAETYDFLNLRGGFLLIHSLASIRVPYIKLLRKNFPNMNIIIAHMGRDAFNHFDFISSILNEFKNDDKIFFDVSTIHSPKVLSYGIKLIGSKRILFASDFPYECTGKEKISDFYQVFYHLRLSNSELENIFYRNAANIAHLCRKNIQ